MAAAILLRPKAGRRPYLPIAPGSVGAESWSVSESLPYFLIAMPPATSADNGSFAYLITIRPRAGNYTRERVNNVLSWLEQSKEQKKVNIIPDWIFAVEEESNHAHICVFLHYPYQRGNLVKELLKHPLQWMDHDEAKNFSSYNRLTNQAACKSITSVEVVASYLSGGAHYAAKEDRPFEVLLAQLPEDGDISALEEYLPAVDGLKRKRQISVWYAEQERLLQAEGVATSAITLPEIHTYLARRMFKDRDMEICVDPRILRQRINGLYAYMTQPEHLFDILGYANDQATDHVNRLLNDSFT